MINTEASGDQIVLTNSKTNSKSSRGNMSVSQRQGPGFSDINDANRGGRPVKPDSNDPNGGSSDPVFPSRNKAISAVGSLSGNMQLNGGILFDADQPLVGSGDLTAMLDSQQTKNASTNGYSVSDVINNTITSLEGFGFTEF